MTWADLLRSAFSGLGQHKLRTLLTLMGVILGALLLFTSLSGGLGVIHAVNERLAVGNRLLEVTVTTGLKVDEVTVEAARDAGFAKDINEERTLRLAKASGLGGQTKIPVTLATVQRLKEIEHVAHAWALLRFGAAIQLAAKDQPVDRWANVSVETLPPFVNPYAGLIVAGEDIKLDSVDKVLVSEYFLYQQGVRTDRQLNEIIGSNLKIRLPPNAHGGESTSPVPNSRDVTIAGVFRHPTRSELNSAPELVAAATRQVLVPYALATQHWKQIGNVDRPISAKVLADQPENVARIEKSISKDGFRTISLSELALQIRTAVLLITGIITAIAGGALFISAIGITNTMVMNVMQRRKDIAIMKAIGAKDRDVNRLFLVEGMLLGVIGGLIGLALGWTLTHISGDYITQVLEEQLNEPFIGNIFAYPIWLIIGTPIVAAIVTTLATFLPARRAAKIDPSTTLRAL